MYINCHGTNQVRTTKSLKTSQTALLDEMNDELGCSRLLWYEP